MAEKSNESGLHLFVRRNTGDMRNQRREVIIVLELSFHVFGHDARV